MDILFYMIITIIFFLSQSQLEIMEKSLSPEDFQELSQSILLDGKEPGSQIIISEGISYN